MLIHNSVMEPIAKSALKYSSLFGKGQGILFFSFQN